MLKLNYTVDGLYMERIKTPPERWIAQRVVLTVRSGQPLILEPGYASFLLPADLPELATLRTTVRQGRTAKTTRKVTLIQVDDEFVEVNLRGTWVAESKEAHEGVLLTVMSDRTESLIYQLWKQSEAQTASLA